MHLDSFRLLHFMQRGHSSGRNGLDGNLIPVLHNAKPLLAFYFSRISSRRAMFGKSPLSRFDAGQEVSLDLRSRFSIIRHDSHPLDWGIFRHGDWLGDFSIAV